MAVYRTMGNNIKTIIDFISTDDELKLLLFHNGRDALDNNPDDITVKDMVSSHIYPYPNLYTPIDEAKSFVSVYLFNGKNAGSNNIYQRDAKIYVDILCHESIWTMDDGLIRPLLLLDDLDTKIPLLDTEAIRGKVSFVSSDFIQYNTNFCGYRLIYSVTNSSRDC